MFRGSVVKWNILLTNAFTIPANNMQILFKALVYIYASTNDFKADKEFYLNILKARKVWEFSDRDAKVAAFDLTGSHPYFLIADHRHANMPRLLYEVDNLNAAIKTLESNGIIFEGAKFELPDGPCIGFTDHSGNSFGIFQAIRRGALEKEYDKNPRTE